MMTPRLTLAALAALGAAVLATPPVQACDLDGLPGMFGSHRLNPFAARLPAPPPPARQPLRPDERSPQATAPERERETHRQAPAEPETERPRRLWEDREGNAALGVGNRMMLI